MPRDFDSDDVAAVLVFTENVECSGCGDVFRGEFFDHTGSLSVQDMCEPARGDHECPSCGLVWSSDFSGWSMFGEAG